MGKKLLSKKGTTLLVESVVSKDYPDILQFLIDHPHFTDSDWSNASPDERKYEVYFPKFIEEVVSLCSKEWRFAADVTEVKVNDDGSRCDLCGYPACNLLYPIINRMNGKILYVGSECVREFGFSGKEKVAYIAANQKLLKDFKVLLDVRPDVFKQFVLEKSCYADKSSLLIPEPLYSECTALFLDVKRQASFFIKNPRNVSILSTIDELNEKYQQACIKIDQFIQESSKNWRVPQISDIIQIRCSNKPKLIAAIRQNKEIDKSTISYFNSLKFLNTNIRERLTQCLLNLGLHVSDVADLPIGTGFFVYKNPSLPLFLIHHRFSSLFGYALMAEPPISINRLELVLDTCRIVNSHDNFLHVAMPILRDRGYTLHDYSMDADEFHFQHNGLYWRAPLSMTLNSNLQFFFEPTPNIPSALFTIMNAAVPHKKEQDYHDYIDSFEKAGIDFYRL